MISLKSLKEVPVAGKTVLLRMSFENDHCIRASVPTIKYLEGQRAKIVIVSDSLSEQAAHRLGEILNRKSLSIPDSRFPDYAVPHVFFLPPKMIVLDREASLPADICVVDDFSAPSVDDIPLVAGLALAAEAVAVSRFRLKRTGRRSSMRRTTKSICCWRNRHRRDPKPCG